MAKASTTAKPDNSAVIEKLKAEDAAKKEEARIKAQQDEMQEGADEPSPELAEAAAAVAKEIEARDRDDEDEANNVPEPSDEAKAVYNLMAPPENEDFVALQRERIKKSNEAGEKITRLAMGYPRTTPDEHVIFGFGGIKYTLGDLRDLTGIR